MRRLRDVFYISANFEEHYYMYYGMEFKEFIKYCPVEIQNLLITDGKFIGKNYNESFGLETANGKEDIAELCAEDIYGLGNFHWINYCDESALNNCTPQEKAEILYLSHFGIPLESPFFKKINNQFVYLSHDDGWFCKLYCEDMTIFSKIIANKIIESFSTNKRRKIFPMDEVLINQLFELTKEGLLIDFSTIYKTNNSIGLNVYAIGHYSDMDEMYNNLERNKYKAKIQATLEHRNKKWNIDFWGL